MRKAVRPWRTSAPAELHEGPPLALFTDLEPDPARRPRSTRIGWSLLGVATVGIIVVALVPAPYVIEEPGPVYDVLGTVPISGKDVPMITIPAEPTYSTGGTLDMLTVSVRGNRQDLPNWLEVVGASFDPSKAVVPVDSVYPVGVTVEASNAQGIVDMQNSQKDAIAAALTSLGYSFPSTLTVAQTQAGGPADVLLKPDDVILAVNGRSFSDVAALRAGIAANGLDRPATVDIERAGQKMTFAITPVLSQGASPAPIIGIVVRSDYRFPFAVTIQLDNVGGPSAGMMFALGIIDKLTPGNLNGGAKVAGTGTISSTGVVGGIGGIRQKLYGARDAGAQWFLAPRSNCDEVTGHVPSGLTVVSVATLDDALSALKTIAAGGNPTTLPSCP